MSLFAWLDYSEIERGRMMDVIDLFREKDTIDELGLGAIRDAIGNRLFPGTSTVMSRARYYLMVPWTYQSLEAKQVPAAKFAHRARNAELELIDVIESSEDHKGNIGKRARFALKRLPSTIYWSGLRLWGIRNARGSQADYHRGVDDMYRHRRLRLERGAARDMEHDDTERGYWHDGLPTPPASFPNKCSLRLRYRDAEYLADRICTAAGTRDSLLATLVFRRCRWNQLEPIWFHPDQGSWPPLLREFVGHARMFSEVMHGAALLYNHLLMGRLDKESSFEAALDAWSEVMEERAEAFTAWDRRRFWELVREENPSLGFRATTFATAWWDMVASVPDPRRLRESKAADRLIEQREVQLKGNLARLANPSARERWNENSGTRQMDFRWWVTQALLKDIFEGLKRVNKDEEDD